VQIPTHSSGVNHYRLVTILECSLTVRDVIKRDTKYAVFRGTSLALSSDERVVDLVSYALNLLPAADLA